MLQNRLAFGKSNTMEQRQYSNIDRFLMQVDSALHTLFGQATSNSRPNPAAEYRAAELSAEETVRSARLMRVNHCGEVCAQALYQGQALTAQNPQVRAALEQAAAEENDHLQWCEARLEELGGRTSVLNPLFYLGSFVIGVSTGKLGDRVSLGFVAETENQVVYHLDKHMKRLPDNDVKSRAILQTMKEDEAQHAINASTAGGAVLPLPVRIIMQATAKLMTKTTYWV